MKHLELKIYTTLGYIVSLIHLNADDAKVKHVSQVQVDK